MDETDIGGDTKSPEAASAEAARQLAEVRRAQARAQFSTPSWIGPDRGSTTDYIPAQSEPEHDEIDVVVPTVSSNPIPDAAHWAEKAAPRMIAGTVLALALAGLLVSLVLAIVTQSVLAIAGLAASALVAVIFRGALMSSGVTTVDLKGSVLRIRTGGVLDVVNLADPIHRVELIGTPGQPSWRLRVQAVDGRIVELGPKQVDAPELHRIVEYYRAIAERAKRDRDRRFNR